MNCIFSVDVEDWFHLLDLPSTPKISEWKSMPSCVEKNFTRLLDMFSEADVKVTCFFLGWIAERFPHLVKDAFKRGHEIASHGYSHELVYKMTESEFYKDASVSKEILENIIGEEISGYRSAGFSITEDTTWFHDKLIEAGYIYDSSVFPASRGHGGMKGGNRAPHIINSKNNKIIEFPITVINVLGKPFCFFGGGYLRLSPYFIIKKMAYKTLAEKRPVIFYLHPREIDIKQPRLSMNLKRRFQSYINVRTTEQKVKSILEEFKIVTFKNYILSKSNLTEVV